MTSRRMTTSPTDADLLDRAVSALLDDEPATVPPALADELAVARVLSGSLSAVPPGAEFEDALARRLTRGSRGDPGRLMGRFARHHQRLVVTGAVSSVLLSTASAAVLAWRLAHR